MLTRRSFAHALALPLPFLATPAIPDADHELDAMLAELVRLGERWMHAETVESPRPWNPRTDPALLACGAYVDHRRAIIRKVLRDHPPAVLPDNEGAITFLGPVSVVRLPGRLVLLLHDADDNVPETTEGLIQSLRLVVVDLPK